MLRGVAFPCMVDGVCPERKPAPGQKGGCPAWCSSALVEELPTGETRMLTGCFFDQMLRIQEHVIRAANRPAAEISAVRESLREGLGTVADRVGEGLKALTHARN